MRVLNLFSQSLSPRVQAFDDFRSLLLLFLESSNLLLTVNLVIVEAVFYSKYVFIDGDPIPEESFQLIHLTMLGYFFLSQKFQLKLQVVDLILEPPHVLILESFLLRSFLDLIDFGSKRLDGSCPIKAFDLLSRDTLVSFVLEGESSDR